MAGAVEGAAAGAGLILPGEGGHRRCADWAILQALIGRIAVELDIRVRLTVEMRQLHHDLTTPGTDGIGDRPLSGDLDVVVDARRVGIAIALP
ncbi:MAG: hypothetical protein ACJASD_002678 [Sphingomonas echinoides]|jgi:hypothetical protein